MLFVHAARRVTILLAIALVILPAAGMATEDPDEHTAISCSAPAWSPDGTRIAFSSDAFQAGNWDIYAINSDGSSLARLTAHPAKDEHPTWSPDGSKIAFASDRTGQNQVWTMNADGTNPQQLTNDSHGAWTPAWGPGTVGMAVATTRSGPHNADILLLSATGEEVRWLAASLDPEAFPAWSPNGQTIAYCTGEGIWKRNLDGSARSRLTNCGPNGKWIEARPSWSRQGNRIAYTVTLVDGADGVLVYAGTRAYLMNTDGSGQTPLFATEPVGTSSDPSWSPTADRIAFVGDDPAGEGDAVYTANPDGASLAPVTHTVAIPVFAPDAGTYTGTQSVTITSTTGATIRYTTDGTEPTESSAVYGAPVVVDHSLILKAKAWKTDWFPSFVKLAEYVIQ